MKMRHLHSAGICRAAGSVANRMLLLCMLGIAMPQATFAAVNSVEQRASVSGVIIDANNQETIVGASVLVKGTTTGAVTDIDGKFTMAVDKLPVTLVVTYVGYQKKEVKVSSQGQTTITLSEDSQMMDEVIVTGYGTFKKSAYAGSAANVKADKIADVPTVSFQDMLQGNATGVQFSAASGQPGASSNVSIRGMGSINASNTPLYVIDGVPVMSGSINSIDSDAGLDIMSTLNTNDIASITVIKDAAAASLYGSRAANGVIIITTKQGQQGKPKVSLQADWGFSDFAMEYRPVMSGQQRRDYIYNGLYIGQIRDGESEEAAKAYADENIDDYAPVPWCGFVDWDDVLFKKGSHQQYEASLSGGTDKFKYYSSIAYLKQEGITQRSGLERLTGRLNVEYKATNKLTMGANVLFSNVNQDVYSEGFTYTSPFYSSRSAVTPSDPVYNEDGTWNRSLIRIGDRNPALANAYDSQREYVTRTFNTVYGQYEFIKDLKFKSTFSYDYITTKGKDWADPRTSNGEDINGGMEKKYYERRKMVWGNQLSYAKTFAEIHHLDGLLGYEIDDQYRDYLSGYATNFATSDKNDISNGKKTESVSGSNTRTRMVSYIGRVNYDYDNKYFLGASYRVDGSSRLERSHRWGNFWSVSGAWRIIEEDFMKPTNKWLTDLKLRASYGVNGTLPSDYYGYMALSSLGSGYNEQPAIIISQLANANLKWETNYNLNLGLDFALFDRVNVTLEYYLRNTKNLLMDSPVSMTTGFNSYLMNVGQLRNQGVELEINSTNIKNKNFEWKTTFNLSHNTNKVVNLDGDQTEIISGTQIHKIGHSYRTFYMIEFAGINPENGNPQFYTNDLLEDGTYSKEITENATKAKSIMLDKHAEPNITGGLYNSFRYKWFDLSFLFNYQFGGYSYDTWAQKTEHGGYDMEANIPTYYADSWKNPGDITKYECFYDKSSSVAMHKITNSRRLHSTDYFRLKTLTFGFTLPKQWTSAIGISNARLYMSANNLLTWAAWDYYDPESVVNGSATQSTPPLKTVTFGLNLNF